MHLSTNMFPNLNQATLRDITVGLERFDVEFSEANISNAPRLLVLNVSTYAFRRRLN